MSRVAARCIIFTWDNDYPGIWLIRDYFPFIAEAGRLICPPLEMYRDIFGHVTVKPIPVPYDCSDGFWHADETIADDADSYLGMPQIVLPGMLTIPEVKLVTRTRQSALAKI